jgi:asparagine synthase (glutamine-hydrolysing)
MCGISGIFVPGSDAIPPRADIERMNDALRHRGPDDQGVYVGPGIGLGHRRLSIIDIAGGHQPLSNEDGSVWVLLNGEIYNYQELREELLKKGHCFSTNSDTECIAHIYEELGEECFSRLRGMFAIAIFDVRRHRLLLARDRVGKKPLYYAQTPGRIAFGSELKALLAAGGLSRDIDREALSDYFSFGYVPAPKTIYRSARKLRPGHYLIVSRSGVRESRYWDLSFNACECRREEDWCEAIRGGVYEATRIRLMSDVPLGAFLSGGIDSSSVVAMMARASNAQIKTCSIGFSEEDFDEAGHARRIAEQFHTSHFETTVQPDVIDIVPKLAWHYDEPFADPSAVPTYYVSKSAR